jgi:hypothetical protein
MVLWIGWRRLLVALVIVAVAAGLLAAQLAANSGSTSLPAPIKIAAKGGGGKGHNLDADGDRDKRPGGDADDLPGG